jgi:hypothetical protein
MPTILRIGNYRFFFFSSDREEPVHIHVERDDLIAKFWLDPIRLQESGGFNRSEVLKIKKIVEKNKITLLEAWNDYFNR